MDTHHLFTIPKWLPYNIPQELWTIIFCWEWHLEMKVIHKELIYKVKKYINTHSIINNPNCGYIIKNNKYQGNYWLRYIPNACILVSVNVKCNIKQLYWCGTDDSINERHDTRLW